MTEQPILVLRGVIKSPEGILLIQRSNNDSYEPNIWEFPGGKVDEGETLGGSLRREMREETGITGTAFGKLEPIRITIENALLKKYQGQKFVTLYIWGPKEKTPAVVLSKEHQNYRWVKNLSDLTGLNLKKDVLEILKTCFKHQEEK